MDNQELVDVFERGGCAILPSDTIYGLFADATNEEAIRKIDSIKHSNKPHLMLVSSIDMLNKYVKNITPLHRLIMDRYWPNTLTILFEKNENVSDELTKGSKYVGIRMPDNDMLLDFIDAYDKPLLSTSANITNETVITDVNMISDELKDKVDYIYDGGPLGTTASTLIGIDKDKIVFLREGELAKFIKEDFEDYV